MWCGEKPTSPPPFPWRGIGDKPHVCKRTHAHVYMHAIPRKKEEEEKRSGGKGKAERKSGGQIEREKKKKSYSNSCILPPYLDGIL